MSTVSVASWEEADLTMPAEPGAPQASAASAATSAASAASAMHAPWRAPTVETVHVAPRESREEEEARPLSTSTPKPSAWGSSLGASAAGASPDATWRKQPPAGAWGGRAGAGVGASGGGGGRGAGAVAGASADEGQAMLDRLYQFKSSAQKIKQQSSAAATALGELRHLDALPATLSHGSLLHSRPPPTASSGPLSPGAKAGSGGLEAASVSSMLRMSAASSTTATSTSSSASSFLASSATPTPASSTSSSVTPPTPAAAPTGTGAVAAPMAPSWAAAGSAAAPSWAASDPVHMSIEAAHDDEIREPLHDEIEDEIREPLHGPDTPHPRHSPPHNFPHSMKLPPAAQHGAPPPGAQCSAPAVGASTSAAAAAGPRPPLSATVTDELAVPTGTAPPTTTTPETTLNLADPDTSMMPDENDAGAGAATTPPATTPPSPPVVLKIIVPPSSRSLISGELPRYDGAHAAAAAAELTAALAALLRSTSAPEEAEEAEAAEAAAAGSVRSDANERHGEHLASPLDGDFLARVAAAAAAEAVDALVEELELAETASMRTLSMDDFVLLRLVGKGGYGKVFQVRCHLNHQIYAMKVVDKASIERYRSMENIAIELSILRQHAEARHPFILGLECAFQSASKLHFVMEYVPGGMLFAHLRAHEMFSEKMARFYAAEVIVTTLEHPHGYPNDPP